MKPVRILLADDHTVMRCGLRVLLERHVGIASDLVILLKADLYEGGMHCGVSRVNRGEIRCGSDVRDNHSQLFR